MAARPVPGGSRHLVVQFNEPPTPAQQKVLALAGVSLLGYLGDDAFFASVKASVSERGLARIGSLQFAAPVAARWKLHPDLQRRSVPAWAVVREGVDTAAGGQTDPLVALNVVFHADVPLASSAVNTVQVHGAAVQSMIHSVGGLVVHVRLSQIEPLAAEDGVQYLEPALPPLTEVNEQVRIITEADLVQDPPYSLDGSGVRVLVYDGGTALPTHPDFGGRLTVRDLSGLSDHATHVSCTVGGSGAESHGQHAGMAPRVVIESYGFEQADGVEEGFLYTDPGDLERDYDEAINSHGADLSNNSLGTNVCANGFPCSWTGDYGVTSALIDAIVRGSLGEPFRVFWANGNERRDGEGCPRCVESGDHTARGYHSTAPPACAKNHVTVGALDPDDESPALFTSWGPTDDGRLKPDVCAPGVSVRSCSSAGGYVIKSGTSMATPAVTGVAALLLQDFRAQFPGGPDPRNATMKVLLAHGAEDIRRPGPDYETGFGSVRIRRTIDLMRTGSFLEGELDHGRVVTLWVTVDEGQPELKATLAWDDVPGAPNVEPSLVNDLDLRVFDPAGILHHPWTLDPDRPQRSAVKTSADHRNNIEQVQVSDPMSGRWQLDVIGFNVPKGPQPFSVVVSPEMSRDCNGNGLLDECDVDCGEPGGFCDQPGCGQSADCAGERIPDECEPDCNSNGAADSCDIAGGLSADCNNNGIPDECIWNERDCNGNQIPDRCDIDQGTSEDCNANGIPDECLAEERDCNSNGRPDACDVADGVSDDCNGNGVPEECEIDRDSPAAGGPFFCDPDDPPDGIWICADDCNSNGRPDECDIAFEASKDCDGNEVPDECLNEHVDCNSDGVPDPCNIADGTSEDCNENGRPDECDMSGGDSADCNSNSVPDECDIARHRSRDDDDNGVPDECQEVHYVPNAKMPTIQAAIDAAGDGDLIIVSDGVYTGAGNGNLDFGGKILTLRSANGPDRCVIDLAGVGRGLHFHNGETPASRVIGFTITGGNADQGGGVACEIGSDPLISNCIFRGNAAIFGGGLYCGGYQCPLLSNCLFTGNQALLGGGLAAHGAIQLLNGCTFVGNGATIAGSDLVSIQSIVTMSDSIIGPRSSPAVANVSLEGDVFYPAWFVVRYSDVQDGQQAFHIGEGGRLFWEEGSISVDPMFVDAASGDYHLLAGSACIDTGEAGHSAGSQADIDGQPRIQGGRRDMGADEFVTDCNGNEIGDYLEIAAGSAFDCNENFTADICDLADGRSEDCDASTIPDECELGREYPCFEQIPWERAALGARPDIPPGDVKPLQCCTPMPADRDGDCVIDSCEE